jgi:iron complex outermembrane recepter protein
MIRNFQIGMLAILILSGKASAENLDQAPIAKKLEAVEMEEISVTGDFKVLAERKVKAAIELKDDELHRKLAHTLGETLKDELGIANQSFGPGVGIPVIRGQSAVRVRVLQNGVGGNDVSQLSPDHASSTEPSSAESIQVLRGPATLLYGSGIIGGVVNVIDNRIPTTLPKTLNASFDQHYDSTASESSSSLKADGSIGMLGYHLDGLYRQRGNLSIGGNAINAAAAQALDPTLNVVNNSHGFLPNTIAETLNGSAGVSLLTGQDFAGIGFNQLHNTYGIAPNGGFSNGHADQNVRIDVHQKKYDFRSEWHDVLGIADALRFRLGYTDYFHTELDGGVAGEPFTRGTAFSNKSYEGRIELAHKPWAALRGTLGFQAVSSQFNAFDYTGGQTIVPDSQIDNFAIFADESITHGRFQYELAARVEHSEIAPALNSNYLPLSNSPLASSYQYTPVSASASAVWKINKLNSLNLAVTRAQRAPQVQELLSHGFHDATRSFEEGNPNLDMETSYNLDFGYRYKGDWLNAELNFFNNWAENYIYQQRNGEFVMQNPVTGLAEPCPANTACTPVVQTHQAGALFTGYEGKLIFPVLETNQGLLEMSLFSDYTRGRLLNGSDVPRMPPLRFGFQLEYTQQNWSANLRFTRAQAQDRPGTNDTATSGYELLGIAGQYQLKPYQGADMQLFLKGNNLLDENIRNSVSFLRNFAPEPGRGVELGIRVNY